MGLVWLMLLAPAALLALVIGMGRLERWVTREILTDEIKRYLTDPATPDYVERAVSDLLEPSLAHLPPGMREQ